MSGQLWLRATDPWERRTRPSWPGKLVPKSGTKCT
jgi:hypothetical protein